MLKARLYTRVQPHAASELVSEVAIKPDANNAWPELVIFRERYFVPTPMRGAYREITPAHAETSAT